MKERIRLVAYVLGGVLMLAGSALMITGWTWAPTAYVVGSVLFAAVQLSDRYHGDSFVVKRLYRQQKLGALILVATGAAMFFLKHNEWVVCLTIGVLFELYTAFRIPDEDGDK